MFGGKRLPEKGFSIGGMSGTMRTNNGLLGVKLILTALKS
jgi:hypothetical protein